ncbi:MAG: Gfo/Idh/MocA family oxidoreductase [Thermoguttaceae bacterium]
MTRRTTRRQFIAQAGVASATLSWAVPALARTRSVNEKLNVGFVATGGRAEGHTGDAHNMGLNCVCFAETDKTRWKGVLGKAGWEKAAGYTDWRKMFEKHAKDLDVVFVATPDHSHFAPSMTAASMGISCYTEKPLTWSVREAQLLAAAYAKNPKVVTQMGNQGHAGNGWRLAYEFIKGGAVGDVLEFHTWTNRPIWPQGGDRPKGSDPVPDTLNWDAWIGPAPMRPYVGHRTYHDFNWRGFVDFGSGALGDMACHTTDGIYAIMKPGYAATAEPIFMTGPVKDQFPAGMTIKMTFRPKSDRPGFTTYWYEGHLKDGKDNMPETPEELTADGRKLPRTGNLIIGTKGKMLVEGDYWDSPRLIPESKMKEFGKPKRLLERSPGHFDEFIQACKGEKPREFSQSNWSYSGPMAANVQLGNLCARAGKKLELNEEGRITSDPAVNDLAWREPRKGWGPLEMEV